MESAERCPILSRLGLGERGTIPQRGRGRSHSRWQFLCISLAISCVLKHTNSEFNITCEWTQHYLLSLSLSPPTVEMIIIALYAAGRTVRQFSTFQTQDIFQDLEHRGCQPTLNTRNFRTTRPPASGGKERERRRGGRGKGRGEEKGRDPQGPIKIPI